MTFHQATAVEPLGDGRFQVEVPDGWQQGRGAFGGLVLGALARAMIRHEPEPARSLRTFAGEICGPVLPGAAEIRVHELRRGSNQSNLRGELTQGGKVLAAGTAVLSPARPSYAPRLCLKPPEAVDWRSVEPFPFPEWFVPPFALHYQHRNIGPVPFAGGAEPRTEGFIGEKEPLEGLDAPALIGRLDAWWPTLFSVEDAPRPAGTIQFTAELIANPAELDPAQPFRHRAQLVVLQDGFFLESRELWHQERLVALNQQTFAVIK